jgi:RES domain
MARDPRPRHVTFANVAFRYSNYDTPFWAGPNTDAGRWHTAGSVATQYLSVTPDGAWAELIRHEGLTTEGSVAEVRMQIWVVRINQARIADYSTFTKAEEAGFAAGALVSDDYTACQTEGARLRAEGYSGVLAPSASLPNTVNLTLFGARLRASFASVPRLARSVPATVVAVGAPRRGLVAEARHFGATHPGLAAHQRARRRS